MDDADDVWWVSVKTGTCQLPMVDVKGLRMMPRVVWMPICEESPENTANVIVYGVAVKNIKLNVRGARSGKRKITKARRRTWDVFRAENRSRCPVAALCPHVLLT